MEHCSMESQFEGGMRNARDAASLLPYDAPPPYDGARFPMSLDTVAPGSIYSGYRHVSFSDAEYEKSVVKSAHRALQVFEFLAEYRRPASATEIAVNLSLPQSSASMLLRSLVSLGYLEYCRETRCYAPTLRLSLISAWRPERVGVTSDILRQMHRLNETTGQCVMLAEQYRHYVRYIYVLQSHDPEKIVYVPMGSLRPICTTACGQMLLTRLPDKELRTIVHRARSDDESVDYGVSVEGVVAAVAQARTAGYAHTSRLVGCFRSYQMAALLPRREDGPRLAIGITSYGECFTERKEEFLTHLLDAVEPMSGPSQESHF